MFSGESDTNYKNATLVIEGGTVYTPKDVIPDGIIVARGRTIEYVGPRANIKAANNAVRLDARNRIVCPGFIDLHVNGGGGKDITAATEEAVLGIAQGHAKCGTTGLLVAVTGPTEAIALQGIRMASSVRNRTTGGAKILGVHMEGPFINPKRQGPVFRGFDGITNPSVEVMKRFVEPAEGALKIVTMAPELDHAAEVIEYLVGQGVVASIGHTEATYEQALNAFRLGVSYAAHIFNQMPGFQHREPGVVGALLATPAVNVELIADGHHVHPGAIRVAMAAKGISHTVLATDAVEVVGTDLTSFTLPVGGGLVVEVRDGRTWGPDGQLIGSVLQMNQAVRNMHKWFDIPLGDIIRSATLLPAEIIGVGHLVGSLERGKAADIAILDEAFDVVTTVVDGAVVHQR